MANIAVSRGFGTTGVVGSRGFGMENNDVSRGFGMAKASLRGVERIAEREELLMTFNSKQNKKY